MFIGFMAILVKVETTWNKKDAKLPSSVIVKSPTTKTAENIHNQVTSVILNTASLKKVMFGSTKAWVISTYNWVMEKYKKLLWELI